MTAEPWIIGLPNLRLLVCQMWDYWSAEPGIISLPNLRLLVCQTWDYWSAKPWIIGQPKPGIIGEVTVFKSNLLY